MRRVTLATSILVILALQVGFGQVRPAASRPAAPAAAPLPVRRAVLYKNGIGYFEHIGKVRGNQPVIVDLTSAQLDDVLNSLTALDLGNGTIGSISYGSEAPVAERLRAIGLPSEGAASLADFLKTLRGVRLEVRSGTARVSGRLLSVERREVAAGANAVARDQLHLVTDAGEIRTIDLTPAVHVRIADREPANQVGTYLSVLSSTHAPDRRRLTVSTSGTGERDVLVSYVTETPVWKTSYRVVFSPDGEQPLLQGWAIVDNTTGEDWTNVNLSLIAGAPQSFIQQISRPRYVRRPIVQPPQALLLTPQTHDPTLTVSTGRLHGTVRDTSGAVLPGVTVRVVDAERRTVAQAVTNATGAYVVSGLTPGSYRIEFTLTGFSSALAEVAVHGDRDVVQNVELRVGAANETVTVTGEAPRALAGRVGGAVGGTGGGVFSPAAAPQAAPIPPADALAAKLQEQAPAASGQELTEMFEYRLNAPVTIPRNQSALVPIINTRATVERVSIWNARTGAQPLRGLWLTNDTGLTLDSGSFTVLDSGVFAGEGLLDPLKPAERRLVSYGVDLGVQVDSRQGDRRLTTSRIVIAHGILVQHREQRSRRAYTIRNNDTSGRTVVIEHPIRSGWTLADNVRADETSAGAYRFKVSAPAGQTTTLTVDEVQPLDDRFEVASLTDDQIRVIVNDAGGSTTLKAALGPILEKKSAIAALARDLASHEKEIGEISVDQQRIRENLTALRGTAEERRLAKRYADQLAASEDRLASLQQETNRCRQALTSAQAELTRIIEALAIEVSSGQ